MIKKIHLIIFLLFLTSLSFGQNFWERIASPTDNFLRTLHFADSLRGWVAGDSGSIFYTSDGGLNWVQQQTNHNYKIMKLFFLDENIGWAVAWEEAGLEDFYGTYILKTTDGGENWVSEQYREESVFLYTIYFLDTLKGFMGGYPGKFLITTDSGMSWENAQIDSGGGAHFPPVNFNFFNDQYGFATGGAIDRAGVVWKTTNGGETWKSTIVGPEPVYAIYFFDSLIVLGVGGDFEYGVSVSRTIDAGVNWEYEELGIFGVATAVSFRTETEAWAPLSFNETIMYSFNSGNTWTDTATVYSSSIYDLVFTDSLTGYAVGEEGVILKYKYQSPTELIDNDNLMVKEFDLYQNYPNPFNSSTIISYYLSESGQVSVKIYDILGNYVSTLVEDYKKNGNYSVVWYADNKPSGVYYVKLNVNGKLATKKMLLLK